MFRRCRSIIVYALTISMLAGSCPVTALAASTDEEQIAIIEEDVENSEDDRSPLDKDSLDEQTDDWDANGYIEGKDHSDDEEGLTNNKGSNLNQEEDDKDQGQTGDVQGQTGSENDDSNNPAQNPDPEVTRIDLSEAELILDKDSFVFDGSIPHPEITVTLNAVTLVKDSDYEVLYDESPDVGIHTVTINGIGEYTGSAQIEYIIEKKEQTIEGTPSYSKRLNDEAFALDVSNNGDGELVYESSNNAVVTVSGSGIVTIKGVGTAVLSVFAEETQESKKSDVFEITIKVLKNVQTVTATANYKKVLGQSSFKINAFTNGNGTLRYSSNNNKVAAVDNSGKITIKGMGIAKIKIYAVETSTFEKSAATTVTIKVLPKKTLISSVANTANNKATVKWKKQAGITGYQIQYSVKNDYSKAKTVSASASSVAKVLSSLTKNATYYVRIRSFKTVNGEKLYSAWSASKSVKIKKGVAKTFSKTPVINVKAHEIKFKNIISWSKLSGATGYEIYFKKGPNSSWKKAGATKTISYTHSAYHGIRYYYKVRAYQDLADGSRIYGKFSKEVNKLQYYIPEFSVQMKSETDPSTGVFVLFVSNTGNATMRIYSKGALLRDNDYVKYNRELYLSKTTVDHIDLSEAKYIDIKPGYSAIIAFISKGDDTWYDSKTRIYYQFRYDGVDYVASSSNYFGTSYTRN